MHAGRLLRVAREARGGLRAYACFMIDPCVGSAESLGATATRGIDSIPAAWVPARGLHWSRSFASKGEDASGREGSLEEARHVKMQDLLERLVESEESEKAKRFLDAFFVAAPGADGSDSSSSSSGSDSSSSGDTTTTTSSSGSASDAEDDDDDEAGTDVLHSHNEDVVLRELKGLRRGSLRVVLQKLLQGGILQADATAAEELKKIERSFRPPPGFRMKVVHIARTSKGTRAGGLFRFSALVVVGNGEGVLGWGTGKAVEVSNAVQKAQQSAYRNLYPIPRHNNHTIPEEVTASFGKTKVIMYPKSSGRGIKANPMLASICQLAGIYDIGIKVHGSRNPQNTIKCLFAAFDKLKDQDEIVGFDAKSGLVTIPVLTGRFGRIEL